MGKKDFKSIFWIVLSGDDLFGLFEKVVNGWMSGELAGEDGEFGKKKLSKQISQEKLRCFEGEALSVEDIKLILQKVLDKEALFKKAKGCNSPLPDMEELALSVKTDRKLKEVISSFLHKKYPEKFPDAEWSKIVAVLPALGTESEMGRLRRATGEEFLKSLLRSIGKTKEEKTACPPGLRVRLEDLYNTSFNLVQRKRPEPYLVIFSNNCMKTRMPEDLGEAPPKCPLAIVDFSRQNQREWTQAEVYSLIEYIMDTSAESTVVIVFCVKPGGNVNVQCALADFSNDRKAKIHLEFGRYSPLSEGRYVGRYWKGIGDQIVFAGVSLDADILWSDIFVSRERALWVFHENLDFDFDLREVERLEEEEEEEKIILDLLQERAPNYRILGPKHRDPGHWVNDQAKPARMLRNILEWFTQEGDTVMDFFSGGNLMRVALQERRECYVISDTEKEWNWTNSFAQLMCQKLPGIMRQFKILRAPMITSHAPPTTSAQHMEGENSSDDAGPRLRLEDRETGAEVASFQQYDEDEEGDLPPPFSFLPQEPLPVHIDPEFKGIRALQALLDKPQPTPMSSRPSSLSSYLTNPVPSSSQPPFTGFLPQGESLQQQQVLVPSLLSFGPSLEGRSGTLSAQSGVGGHDGQSAVDDSQAMGVTIQESAEDGEIPDYLKVVDPPAQQAPSAPQSPPAQLSPPPQKSPPAPQSPPAPKSPKCTGSGQAGASLLRDTNETLMLSHSESTIVLPFSGEKVTRKIGEVGGVRMGADLLHYRWLDGPLRGCNVDIDEAPAIMNGNKYKREGFQLVPVWGSPYEWDESPGVVNREIQALLEDTQVNEYGSFMTNV
jgi:hypothetical protein